MKAVLFCNKSVPKMMLYCSKADSPGRSDGRSPDFQNDFQAFKNPFGGILKWQFQNV